MKRKIGTYYFLEKAINEGIPRHPDISGCCIASGHVLSSSCDFHAGLCTLVQELSWLNWGWGLLSLLSTIIYISTSQSNSWLCFVKKTFCAKWVWKTLFCFLVCVCVCVAVKLACWHWYLNFIVFSCSHEICPSPTPQLNTVKTIWRDEYRPLGVIFQPQV